MFVQSLQDIFLFSHFSHKYQTENGEIRDTELLSVVYIDGKKYAVYC